MLMRFYLGFAVGDTYTQDLHHPIVSEAPEISLEYEGIDVIYIPDQDKGRVDQTLIKNQWR